MPKLPSVTGELGGAIRRGKGEGRLGPEHRLDLARARLLAALLTDPATPRSAVAALDRRFDVVLIRLGLVAPDAAGPSELDDWLAGLAAESAAADLDLEGIEGEGSRPLPAPDNGQE